MRSVVSSDARLASSRPSALGIGLGEFPHDHPDLRGSLAAG